MHVPLTADLRALVEALAAGRERGLPGRPRRRRDDRPSELGRPTGRSLERCRERPAPDRPRPSARARNRADAERPSAPRDRDLRELLEHRAARGATRLRPPAPPPPCGHAPRRGRSPRSRRWRSSPASAPERRSRPAATSRSLRAGRRSARTPSSTRPTGSLLGSIPAETNREPVPLAAHRARGCRRRTVAVEDRRFYQHGGVDYVGIARALWQRRQRRQGRRGRLDDRAAARAQPLHGPRANLRAQAQGGLPRDQAEQQLVEGQDPRRVPEHGLLRQPRLRRRGRVADVLLASTRGS